MNGILIVNKPKQMTSHDVVNIVRRIIHTKKVGHTGTLDPDATGVLVIAINDATKVIPFLEEVDKTYECVITVGYATQTEDASGEITQMLPVEQLEESTVDQVLSTFLGPSKQVPPMYSAIKVDGKKLYEYARLNIEVSRKARDIYIHEIRRNSPITISNHVAHFSFIARVSKGTYIRTLCVDIGKVLGFPAHMKSLIRTKSGIFSLEDAYSIEEIKENHFTVIPILESLKHLKQMNVDETIEKNILNGMKISLSNIDCKDNDFVVLTSQKNQLLAVYQKKDTEFRAVRVWK